jgi:GNAT superfamily N-acetyltransferase
MTKRSRRIPAAFVFLEVGLRAVEPQTEDEMSIVETVVETVPPPASIRVRLAGPRDCESLCELLDRPEHAYEQVMAWLQTPGTTLLVAQSELGVMGVAVLVTRVFPRRDGGQHKVVEVDNLVVRADQRGRRIGRRLLAAAVEWSRQRRAAQVEAFVGDVNAAGRRFYESFGFSHSVDRLVLAP